MKKILLILMWSVIAAAFIGPGTVTTAASAGSHTGFQLLWTLLFSMIACFVLQEASARITIASRMNLGQAIRRRFSRGVKGIFVLILVLGAIVLGCAAYEAGNILGSVAGVVLEISVDAKIITLTIGLMAFILLSFGSVKVVARILGVVVAVMGCMFLATAFMYKPPMQNIIKGLFIPTFPSGSAVLILGLVGTTVVPYNLFLGSGLAENQKMGEMRFALAIAIFLGGVISMAVLIVGTTVSDIFTFEGLSLVLEEKLGNWASIFFALGLFAAGFSSAVTAPLAAAITAKSLFEKNRDASWSEKSNLYRSIWITVLGIGIFFGLWGIKPIPAIILAQALNGILLPFIAVFLFLVVNDEQLMGKYGVNGLIGNVVMSLVVMVTILLGTSQVVKATTRLFHLPPLTNTSVLIISAIVCLGVFFLIIRNKSSWSLK